VQKRHDLPRLVAAGKIKKRTRKREVAKKAGGQDYHGAALPSGNGKEG